MLTVDRVAGAALALVAAVVLVESRVLPLGTLQNPGPAYMPVVLATVLLAFGIGLVFFGGKGESMAAVGWRDWKHAVAILGGCIFSALLLERLGYRLTVGAMVLFLVGLVERKGVVTGLVFAVVLAAGSFYLFDTILRVPLPRSPWGF